MLSTSIIWVLMVTAGHSGQIPTLEFVSEVECHAAGVKLYPVGSWERHWPADTAPLSCISINKTPIK